MDKEIKIAIISAIAVIIAAIIQSGFFNNVTEEPTPKPTSDIRITHPSDSAMVNMTEIMIGNATNIPEDQKLWITIYPQTAHKYYPQNPVNIQNDGSWRLSIQFGGENNVGEKFDIVAVLADKNAQKVLNDYMEASAKAKFWKGMEELPDGTTEIIKFTVTRRQSISTELQSAKISINYPSNPAMVNVTETIIGNATNIPEGQKLWIAIYPQTAYKYYPQNSINTQNDGSWRLPVNFGGENNVGEKFDIIAVLADKNAQKVLNDYMEVSAKAEFWKGMEELPDGTTEITRSTVIRV